MLLLLCVILVLILLKIVHCLWSDKTTCSTQLSFRCIRNQPLSASGVCKLTLITCTKEPSGEEMMAASKMKQEQADHEDDDYVSIMDNECSKQAD